MTTLWYMARWVQQARCRRDWRLIAGAVLGVTALALAAPFAHAAPVIMILQSQLQGSLIQAEVEAVPELVTSPLAGKALPKWSVVPGEAVKSKQRPQDRVVHLLRKVGLEYQHICSINLRYFPDKQGAWLPHFQLDEQPAVVRKNGRWQPLTTVRGLPSLVVLTSNTLPNAEGFYSSLEFGLTLGLMSIDSWIVR